MHPLSVVIITFNEERNIARCIESVRQLADEIIVLDSYSTDDTVSIARSLGAVVHQEKFRGYIGQKNMAMWLATHHHILSLDADEALDAQLAAAIQRAKTDLSFRAYTMNRCTCYCGHFIRYGLWYPDRKLRLFDRRIAEWGGLNPHDKVQLKQSCKVQHLPGDILHYSFNTAEDLPWQNNRMSSIAATSLYAAGKRSNWMHIIFRPAWAFVNGYFLRRGFLNGFDGFTIAVHTSHQVFMKWSKLYRLQKASRKRTVVPLEKPKTIDSKSASADK
jgi:glycosyltransferase involved in cell wall biosynthesis